MNENFYFPVCLGNFKIPVFCSSMLISGNNKYLQKKIQSTEEVGNYVVTP